MQGKGDFIGVGMVRDKNQMELDSSTEKYFVFTTTIGLKLFTEKGELSQDLSGNFTHMRCTNTFVIVS